MPQPTPRYTPEERPAKLQEALNAIGSWLLGVVTVEPGWSELVLDLKPHAHAVFARITETRDDTDTVGSVGPIKDGSPVLPEIKKLQEAAYVENEGTWLTASIVIAASGWPTPSYSIGASYNRMLEPTALGDEGPYTTEDIRAHFTEFSRTDEHTPIWAAARLATADPRATQAGPLPQGPINTHLTDALKAFETNRTEQALANVVRTAQGGHLIMDITQSTTNEEGQPHINYQVLRLANGMRALTAYSSAQAATSYSASLGQAQARLAVEPAAKVYMQVAQDPTIDVLVIDPGSSHECFVEKPQIQWVLSSPHNLAAQRALSEENMHNLLLALAAPSSILLFAVRPDDSAGRPIMVKPDEGSEPHALVFTSVADIAALDPTLQVRSAPALDVLKLIASSTSPALRINALAPHATLPMEQVRELINLAESSS